VGFKDLPGGKNDKNKKASTDFAKEISPQMNDKNSEKCK
jgi:hypothetical protein